MSRLILALLILLAFPTGAALALSPILPDPHPQPQVVSVNEGYVPEVDEPATPWGWLP